MVKKAAHATPNSLLKAARKERGWTQQQVADRIGAPLSLNVSRWENGTTLPSAYYIERICQLFGKTVSELGLSQIEGQPQAEQLTPSEHAYLSVTPSNITSDLPPPTLAQQQGHFTAKDSRIMLLPYLRNPFFLGRDEILTHLRSLLLSGQAMALCQPQAITGLGGIGKTQVALEYAYRYAGDYQAVIWIQAGTRATLVTGYFQVAQALELPERNEREQAVVIQAVKSWLRMHSRWLLILDNADDLPLLPEFLPDSSKGHLLLTTRAQALGHLANRIEIETLDQDKATLLLLRRSGLLTLETSLVQLEQSDRNTAALLAWELGGLPLALDQAGAYLEETGCSLEQYLNLYRSHRSDILHHRGVVVSDHPDSVATTLSLSFESVQRRSALAADVLRLCAVIHPDAIPEELFTHASNHLGPLLATIETDPLSFNQALAVIQSFSLLRRASREHTLSIHRLTQAVIADSMSEQERNTWTRRAIAALDAVFPPINQREWEQWELCRRLLPHVLNSTPGIATQHETIELASLLTKTADYLLQQVQYMQAEPLYLRALQIDQRLLNQDDPRIAFPLNGLADLYREQGRYSEAELLYLRALNLWEQTHDLEHSEIPSPLNNLAILYIEQGNYQQAEPLLQRALLIDEQAFGPENPEIAPTLNNLAILYLYLGNHQRAEPLLQRALRIDELTYGSEHPEVAFSLTNLADLYRELGNFAEAQALYQRALHIREQTLGPEHLQVVFPLYGLAAIYLEKREYTLSESLYQRALHICEQTLGPNHAQLAFPLNGLANIYREQGRYEQAERFYQRALSIRLNQRGPHHLETAETLHDFAHLHEVCNRRDQARTLYHQSLTIRKQQLGPDHPLTHETHQHYKNLT